MTVNEDKDKEQLILELTDLRRRVVELATVDVERRRAEEALQTSERYNTSLLENAPHQIFVVNADTSIRYVNPAFEKANGWTLAEIIGMKAPYPWWPEEQREKWLPGFLEAMKKNNGKGEVISQKKNGERYWIALNWSWITHNGKPLYVLANAIDITERRQMEEALRESEERYRELAESITDVFFAFDEDLRYTYWNKASEELTGISAKAAIGKHLYDIFPRIEETANAEREYLEVLRTKKPRHFVNEYYIKDKLYFFAINAYPTKDGLSVFTEDITEEIKAEEALRESEERYRALVNLSGSIGEAIIMLKDTEQGNAIQTFVSNAWPRITGYSRKELLGMSFFDLLHSRYREAFLKRHKRKLSGEIIPGLFEMSVIRKDGTEVPIEVTSAYTTYRGERANVAFIRDITERKQAEEREKELQQELNLSSRLASVGELAAGVAHEINNPLTGIIGFSERLLRKSADEEIKQYLEKIYSEAQRAARVVENLRTFARRREIKKEYLDVNEILEKTLELRAYELITSNIKIVVKPSASIPKINGDFGQIQQVFLNIIINSEQAMTEANGGGKINIKTQKIKDFVRISFTDDGPGIVNENLDRVFDPFFTTRGERGGTGLGLSACHGIVSEHGGRIYAKSKSGTGATFFVELPEKSEMEGD